MNKPISKHALRRAFDRMVAEGHVQVNEPVGTFIDRIWHELHKKAYAGTKKKPVLRDSLRTAPVSPDAGEA